MQNKNSIKRLVKNNCACYLGAKHGIPNYCCLQDGPCVFFAQDDSLPRCTYFENGVLPIDEKLDREYKSERNVESEFKTVKLRVNCTRCRGTFSANSNRQKYCGKCRGRARKENIRIRVRKFRQKDGSM
ncbi:UNVERIFIED_CONTAM: ribosomal protein S27AE [Paenibacillus sp. PvR008]